jgi:hypothetical protein
MTAAPIQAHPAALGVSAPSNRVQIGGWQLFRARLAARFTRIARWEFWPSWAIYLPLIPYLIWLSMRHWRTGGPLTCTRVNPGIPLGGIVGESKWDILQLLPRESIVPTSLILPGPTERRVAELETVIRDSAWTWPIVLKPDVGERGRGVRVIGDISEAMRYLRAEPRAVLAQAHHPGPFEAGVFYIRHPNESRGRIFSITDKRFPSVIGDGRSTIRTLIWHHPRLRAQSKAILHGQGGCAERVPEAGREIRVGDIGNHCRGAMFLDGADLITTELTEAIDDIGRHTEGFYFGRFDVRYESTALLKRGQGFRIVELNGLLSESTNIYDPCTSFWRAQRVLREQWRLAFEISAVLSEARFQRLMRPNRAP